MSSEGKARKFAGQAEANGWIVTVTDAGDDRFDVRCVRGDEIIEIFWVANSLTETPKYTLAGRTTSLHNAAGATRQLSMKPDLNKVYKKSRRVTPTKVQVEAGETTDGGAIPVVRHELPFDIWESSDREILRACRGSRIVWLNKTIGTAEVAHIPKQSNLDLKNTFFIAESSAGKPYLSFMDELGRFRAVHLENILQVG